MFKEIKLSSSELENIQLIGWGLGKAINPEIAMQKAKMNATINLMDQINGRDFVYEKADGSKKFSTTIKGKISGTKIVDSYNLDDRTVLMILSASPLNRDYDLENAYLMEIEFRTENLEKAIIEYYQNVINEVSSRYYIDRDQIIGKLFLIEINLTDYEEKSDFAVKMKILVVITI